MKEIMKGELIGSNIKIIDAKNKTLIGLKGKIINETKNTLVINQGENQKKLIKNQIIIQIKKDNKQIRINGKRLTKRPEDRLKK